VKFEDLKKASFGDLKIQVGVGAVVAEVSTFAWRREFEGESNKKTRQGPLADLTSPSFPTSVAEPPYLHGQHHQLRRSHHRKLLGLFQPHPPHSGRTYPCQHLPPLFLLSLDLQPHPHLHRWSPRRNHPLRPFQRHPLHLGPYRSRIYQPQPPGDWIPRRLLHRVAHREGLFGCGSC